MKGFYRDEGLDLETILIRGSVGMQALLGGSVDYCIGRRLDHRRRRSRHARAAGLDRQCKAAIRSRQPSRY